MTFDHWKTTDPREYEREQPAEDQPSELDLAYEHIHQLRDLVQTLIDNDPVEPIADNGMTVLDGWRDRAKRVLGVVGKCEQAITDTRHYLNAIRHRLETLYALSANDPRLREHLSDEVDWIDSQIGQS